MANEKPKKEKVDLELFLAQQADVRPVGTIETISTDKTLIKFTPWFPGGGCLCSASINLPKDVISAVYPTGEIHVSCGKTLKVVEVEFVKGKSIPIVDVVSQLLSKIGTHEHREERSVPTHGPTYGPQLPFLSPPKHHHGPIWPADRGCPFGCGSANCCCNLNSCWCQSASCY